MAIRKIISRSIGVDVIAAEDLAAGSVQTAEIQNAAVTGAKLAANLNYDSGTLFLDSSNNRVGMGTTTPSKPLHVKGDVDVEGVTGGVAVLRFKAEETHGTVEGINIGSNYGGLAFKTNNNGTVAEKVRITNDGKVGISNSSPSHLLDATVSSGGASARFGTTHNSGANNATVIISNGGSGKAMLRFDYEGSNTDRARIGVTSSGQQLEFYTAGDNERMRIDSNGFVGIGETSPKKALHLTRGDSDNIIIFDANGVTTDNSIVWSKDYGTGSTSGGNYWGIGVDGSENRMVFAYDANSQASLSADAFMYMYSNGRVSVGTTSNISDLNTGGSGISIIQAHTNGRFRQIYQSGDQNLYFNSGTNQPYLSSGGSWTNSSDVAYKKDITDATYGIDTVKDMRPRFYYMKAEELQDEDRKVGFIAQELENIVPEVVSGEDGSKGVDYGALTAVLTGALQEAIEEIERLKSRLDSAGL